MNNQKSFRFKIIMGKTIRHKYTRNLFHNGDRGPLHTLLKEHRETEAGLIKDWRNLLHRRDYKSDRAGGWRHISSQLCRTRLNRKVQKEINEEIENYEFRS